LSHRTRTYGPAVDAGSARAIDVRPKRRAVEPSSERPTLARSTTRVVSIGRVREAPSQPERASTTSRNAADVPRRSVKGRSYERDVARVGCVDATGTKDPPAHGFPDATDPPSPLLPTPGA
jgi:hypothetical protein